MKHLLSCPLSKKAFRSQMGRIGKLGYPGQPRLCVVEEERLLVYKHKESGALTLSKVMKEPWETLLALAMRLKVAARDKPQFMSLYH